MKTSKSNNPSPEKSHVTTIATSAADLATEHLNVDLTKTETMVADVTIETETTTDVMTIVEMKEEILGMNDLTEGTITIEEAGQSLLIRGVRDVIMTTLGTTEETMAEIEIMVKTIVDGIVTTIRKSQIVTLLARTITIDTTTETLQTPTNTVKPTISETEMMTVTEENLSLTKTEQTTDLEDATPRKKTA